MNYSDVGVCRPKSLVALKLGRLGLEIDLGELNDPADVDLLVIGFRRQRKLMAEAVFGFYVAPEAFLGNRIKSEEQIRAHITARTATAFHPVGTLRMDEGNAPFMMIGHRAGQFICEDAA